MKISYVGTLLLAVFVVGCKPSAEELAQAEVLKKEYCLNHFCAGDIEPKRDPATESFFKANGRWFIGPREYYAVGYGDTGFYWPSKTPVYTSSNDFPERDDLLRGEYPNIAVTVFVGSLPPSSAEMYPNVLEQAENKYGIASREILRAGFERVIQARDPGGYTHLYIAYGVKTPGGVPALVGCNPRSYCSMRFPWNGLTVDLRFKHRHVEDWPEIYAEVLRILSLLREETK